MADGNAAAVAGELGLAHHFVEVHPAGVEIKVEMEVDGQVKAASDGEDTRDMLDRLGVGVWTAADQVGAGLTRLHQQRFRPRIVEQAFLREDADGKVDGPPIAACQLAHGTQTLQADAWVDLDVGAHVHGPGEDGAFQGRLARARRCRPR